MKPIAKFPCLIWANLFHFVPSAPATHLGVLQLREPTKSCSQIQQASRKSQLECINDKRWSTDVTGLRLMALPFSWNLCGTRLTKVSFHAPQLTFCNHCVLFSMALSRISSFCSCQEGLSCWVLSAADRLASVDACGGESLWRVLLTLKSFEGRQWSTSGRMNV